jgi:inosine-uridine nucleoside N-ribohydrolase
VVSFDQNRKFHTMPITEPPIDDRRREYQLAPPKAHPRVVIDTDAANEIDDQFALAWALLSPEQMSLEAVYATPYSFAHRRSALAFEPTELRPFVTPGEGMARSLDEIHRVFALCGEPERGRVHAGAQGYLADAATPQRSAAVDDLIARAMSRSTDEPLYVLALGCLTNVASALMIEPRIAERIVVVWTSGYPSHAPHVNHSFNLEQDMAASQRVMQGDVPLVYLPGFHVGAQLRLSLPEVERWVQGQGAIGDYLHHLFTHNPLWEMQGVTDFFAHSWVIWDLICLAWVMHPADEPWVGTQLARMPLLGDDKRWVVAPNRPWMREGHAVRRDAVFRDFFKKLAKVA